MFGKILVPLDGSELSDAVLWQVKRLLVREDAQVSLLTVVVPLEESWRERPPERADAGRRSVALRREDARRHLERQQKALEHEGVQVSAEVVFGDPAHEILRCVERDRPGLVAMATHGRAGVARLVRGSVAERVLRGCPVPVLLCNPRRDASRGVPFKKVLVPLDGSERSASVLERVIPLARSFESEVVLLHVTPIVAAASGVTLPIVVERDDAVLTAFEARVRGAGLPVRSRIVVGDAAAEILAAAETEQTDLIAMATHGRTGLDRWLLGSVAENVLRHCRVPILLERSVPLASSQLSAAETEATAGAE